MPSGKDETITLWAGRIADAGPLTAGTSAFDFSADLPARSLPTARSPHGRTDATFRVILARAWAPDHNLVRDIALATTAEL